ncbi:MAG TPA: hypothetical protein VHZ96_22170 [Frankiaceae bacterium]|jgi:hypothetical protein|nr:hypothetical protein [Frankiaceae bacterium]
MATIAFEPPPSVFPGRPGQRRAVSIPAPNSSLAPLETVQLSAVPATRTQGIVHVLPLSGCRLTVLDLPDGSRIGRLSAADGRWLAEARCELESQVSGWFGRGGPCGTSWALAFGAGGSHESVQVRFASLRARRVVPVVSDHYGLWVAEVSGAFRAATILSPSTTNTFRLHYAS